MQVLLLLMFIGFSYADLAADGYVNKKKMRSRRTEASFVKCYRADFAKSQKTAAKNPGNEIDYVEIHRQAFKRCTPAMNHERFLNCFEHLPVAKINDIDFVFGVCQTNETISPH